METNVRRDMRNNWRAETTLPLGFNIEGHPAWLHILTSKRSHGALVTTASVSMHDGNSVITRVFHDFHRTMRSDGVRVTEKALRTIHAAALADQLSSVLADAYSHHREQGDLPPAVPVQHDGWTLRYTIGDFLCGPVNVGELVSDSRGEVMRVEGGASPHKPSSSGRVFVRDMVRGWDNSYYPSVIGARWVHDTSGGHARDTE